MHFFRSREDAEGWLADRRGVVVLTVAEADALAQFHWVERKGKLERGG